MSKSPIVQRNLTSIINKVLKQFPIVSITGPRQSGKTTLCHLVGNGYTYLNLEIDEHKTFATKDPAGFLEKYKGGVILDEVQTVPALFPYLQYYTDKRNKNGEYILSGSQNFLLLEKITQTLAGRVAVFSLLPFSLKEIMPYLTAAQKKWYSLCFRGFYPRLYKEKKMNASVFYASYFKTYVERDVRQIINIHSIRTFQQFIKLCAARVGSIFNAQEIARIIGVDNKTISKWIAVLEASYIIYLLPPYYENYDKRILKKPKIYFYDTGLLCYLLNIKTADALPEHNMAGHLFENFVINEMLKNKYNSGQQPNAYFWQDSNQREVDLLIEENGFNALFEIKMSTSIKSDFFKNLLLIQELSKNKGQKTKTNLIYTGAESYKREGHEIISWQDIN